MTILKFEIDTEDLGYDEGGYGRSFESEFHSAIKNQITQRVLKNITKEEVAQYSILVQETVDNNVIDLFNNLINEDIVITDRYGSKEFVGSVEDYIKKSIDEKYMYPVDGEGKKLQGCTSSSQTWVQWKIDRDMKKYLDKRIESSQRTLSRDIEKTIEKKLEEFVNNTITKKVSEKLINLGINS